MERPRYMETSPTGSRAPSSTGSRAGAPSPRIQHFDGDIPPTLSPLDAFAAHSRKLAKELEETRLAGQRRMSRLPPQIVTQSMTEHMANRPAIFRSLSSNSQDPLTPIPHIETELAGNCPDITAPTFRPASTYPRISAVLGANEQTNSQPTTPIDSAISAKSTRSPIEYYGGLRAESPEPLGHDGRYRPDHRNGHKLSEDGMADYPALAPPNAAFARHRLYHESSDDDYTSSNAGSFFSQTRKLSSSSNISLPLAGNNVHNRSPSNNSASSLPGHKKAPSHLNFSRPRSSASSHSKLDSPTKSQHRLIRKTSQASESSRMQTSFDDARSIISDGALSQVTSSHTHSNFQLPRGRDVDRKPDVFVSPMTQSPEWKDTSSIASPTLGCESFPELIRRSHETSEHERELGRSGTSSFSFEFHGERPLHNDRTRRPSLPHVHSSSSKSTGTTSSRPYLLYGAQKIPDLPPIPGSTYEATIDGQSRSSRSNSTVRPTTARSVSNYTNLTPDDHVTKAIDLHQHGDLKESTYHLRIAAKHNHPTGMLLYALACRHGWGMRPNPKDGVIWLKKAVDVAMSEVAEDENEESDKPKADFQQRKEHRAQFALSIYELGVSHLNGWGVEQDKALALRCFEIAGTWGDPDALSEAGFCYAEGVGCKKDLRKAARLYRMAAEKGVSMVGNSWIYKEKYNDTKDNIQDDRARGRVNDSPKAGSASAGRSKSKTRSIFGRKKSIATNT